MKKNAIFRQCKRYNKLEMAKTIWERCPCKMGGITRTGHLGMDTVSWGRGRDTFISSAVNKRGRSRKGR
jgi:hypothetical protein